LTPDEQFELAFLRRYMVDMEVAAKVLGGRLILLVGILGAIGLAYVDRNGSYQQLIGLGIYCLLVGALVWLAGRH
jgi:hypothetical protein